MANETLTVREVAVNGAFVVLSNGRRYLIVVEQHPIAARWTPGLLIHLTRLDYPVNGYELRADTNLSEAVTAVATC